MKVMWSCKGFLLFNITVALCTAPLLHKDLTMAERCEAAVSGFLLMDLWQILSDQNLSCIMMQLWGCFQNFQTLFLHILLKVMWIPLRSSWNHLLPSPSWFCVPRIFQSGCRWLQYVYVEDCWSMLKYVEVISFVTFRPMSFLRTCQKQGLPHGSCYLARQTVQTLQSIALQTVVICNTKPSGLAPWSHGHARLSEISIEEHFGVLRSQSSNSQLSTRGYMQASALQSMKTAKILAETQDPPSPEGMAEAALDEKTLLGECMWMLWSIMTVQEEIWVGMKYVEIYLNILKLAIL